MGCAFPPDEKEAMVIHEAASRIAAECGANRGRAELLFLMYGEITAKSILRSEEIQRVSQVASPNDAQASKPYSGGMSGLGSASSSSPNSYYTTPSTNSYASPMANSSPASSAWSSPQSTHATPTSSWSASPEATFSFEQPSWATANEWAESSRAQSLSASNVSTTVTPLQPTEPAGRTVISDSGVSYSYVAKNSKDFPSLPTNGQPVPFAVRNGEVLGEARKLADGGIGIRSCINDGTGSLAGGGRQGFEKFLPRGSEIGLGYYVRVHAQGQGAGPESPEAIALAHKAVNELQNTGMEAEIRHLADHVLPGYKLFQHTDVHTDHSGMFLKSIGYEVWVQTPSGEQHKLYTHGISIGGVPRREVFEIHRNSSSDAAPDYAPDLERFLKPATM